MKTVTIPVLCWLFAATVHGVPNTQQEDPCPPHHVGPMFDAMEVFARKVQQKVEKKKTGQILVASIASRDDLATWARGGKKPKWFVDDNKASSRLQVFVNRNPKSKNPTHGEQLLFNPVHGENGKSRMDLMLERFEKDEKGEFPYIMLYSYNIPCQGLTNAPSCAELMDIYVSQRIGQFRMCVGYSARFCRTPGRCETNEVNSLGYMLRVGVIDVFKRTIIKRSLRSIESFYDSIERGNAQIPVQEQCHSCVERKQPVTCLPGQAEQDRRILALFINEVAKTCTENSGLSGRIGGPTRDAKGQEVLSCLEAKTKERIGNQCPKFARQKVRSVNKLSAQLTNCWKEAMAFSNSFGRPSGFTTWQGYQGAWKDLYPPNQLPAQSLTCEPRTLSPESFCTKIPPRQTGPSQVGHLGQTQSSSAGTSFMTRVANTLGGLGKSVLGKRRRDS